MSVRILATLLTLCLTAIAVANPVRNGFDLSGASISPRHISKGGPPRDGIPALDEPDFVPAHAAAGLKPDDRVLGVVLNGIEKAYPVRILNWHELVNDSFGETPVLISYCPLCGSGMAFHASVDGQTLQFGVSGLLYNSDVLFYDRQTESLWSQIDARAVTGPFRDTALVQIPLTHTSWRRWRELYPLSLVLSEKTGFSRNYDESPYQGYEKSPDLFFKLARKTSRRYHPKERVLGLRSDNVARAYAFVDLEKQNLAEFEDRFDGEPVTIRWDAANRSAQAFGPDGEPLVSTDAFWFAWYAFHPDTEVFEPAE